MVSLKRSLEKYMVRASEIAEKTELKTNDVEKVVNYIMVDIDNHKRQPALPAPEGGISLRAAGRKYGILSGTLCRWVQKGLIPVLLRTKNWLYVDEAKLVEVIQRYKQNPGQGKKTIS